MDTEVEDRRPFTNTIDARTPTCGHRHEASWFPGPRKQPSRPESLHRRTLGGATDWPFTIIPSMVDFNQARFATKLLAGGAYWGEAESSVVSREAQALDPAPG